MQKTFVVILASLFGIFSAGSIFQEQENIEPDTSRFMQRKLDYSRSVVSGLATENFEEIAKAAQDLMVLSHESDWQVVTTPQYLKSSSDFRETVARLRDAGKKKNLDGATIAYFELTLSCVRCHKQLRAGQIRKARPQLRDDHSSQKN